MKVIYGTFYDANNKPKGGRKGFVFSLVLLSHLIFMSSHFQRQDSLTKGAAVCIRLFCLLITGYSIICF